MKKFFTSVVMATTALSSLAGSMAQASVTQLQTVIPDPIDADSTGAMDAQCQALVTNYTADEVVAFVENPGAAARVSGPTASTPFNRVIEATTVLPAGSVTGLGGTVSLEGDPFRNGGSVNMFALRYASEKYWSNSKYWFTADYDSTYSYSFGCKVVATTHHPDIVLTKDFPNGHYTNPSDEANDEDQSAGSCNGIDFDHPKWGTDIGATVTNPRTGVTKFHGCKFNADGGTTPVEISRTPVPDTVVTDHVTTGLTPVRQDQTDNLRAYEDFGAEPATEQGRFANGQAVVCISPKKLPGTWSTPPGQNYTTSKCTTAWYNDPSIVWNAAHVNTSSNSVTIPQT